MIKWITKTNNWKLETNILKSYVAHVCLLDIEL